MFWFITENRSELEALIDEFVSKGNHTREFTNVSEALKSLKEEIPEGILIDADGSEMPCLEFCHKIKSLPDYKKIILIVVSSSNSEAIEEAMFDAGADEFVTRPIRHLALYKRIAARLSGSSASQKMLYNRNGKAALQIDRESFTVYLNQKLIPLSRKEFELLHLMASHPGKVFTREEIFTKVWNRLHVSKERTIDVHILRLRKKIGEEFITTQKGIGYRFCA